ncbi:hypothetical protein IW262DRAFT_233276 [Armillaria fumosa]|nr:hypothetical protein IW262DRAFT_233276 [Armillaria fumosa]
MEREVPYLDPANGRQPQLSNSIAHLLAKNQTISFSTPTMPNNIQERQGDVTVDLRLDGNLHLEVKVKTELQCCGRGNSLALRAADDLSTEDGRGLSRCEFGFWGRHCDAEERESSRLSFYMRIDALSGLRPRQEQRYNCTTMHSANRVPRRN